MYRLFIASKDDKEFGIKTGLTPVEFYLDSAEDICEVLSTLSSCNMIYTLTECSVSSVDDVKRYFKLID